MLVDQTSLTCYNSTMKITELGQVIATEQDIIDGLYSGKISTLEKLNVDDINLIKRFNSARELNADAFSELSLFVPSHETMDVFDRKNQENWFIPVEYKNLDIEELILSLCKTEEEIDRVAEELDLFHKHDMVIVLKYLKYLVDTMRSNQIVWGVGRGSSVSSYCLYLLGVHKVDSLKYQLDIKEFLK